MKTNRTENFVVVDGSMYALLCPSLYNDYQHVGILRGLALLSPSCPFPLRLRGNQHSTGSESTVVGCVSMPFCLVLWCNRLWTLMPCDIL